ncbi:MAG: hypothetical protein N2204_01725 [Anaerolineae bacterium]|nr:hypothetical protein [Anaerolineae bacterium]
MEIQEMTVELISKPLYRILTDLTREPRLEVALPLAVRDWVRLKLQAARQQKAAFEQRYGMDFSAFKSAWNEGHIPERYSYEVERDYWEWEAAVADEERLSRILDELL